MNSPSLHQDLYQKKIEGFSNYIPPDIPYQVFSMKKILR